MGAGAPYSSLRGVVAVAGAGAPYSGLRGVVSTPGAGAAYSGERGEPVVFGQSAPFRWVRGFILSPGQGSPFRWLHSANLVSRPGAPFRWIRGKPAPLRHFGSPTGAVMPVADPIRSFGGSTDGSTLIPPLNAYGGTTEGLARFGPLFGFSGVTGGVTVFTGVPPAVRLTAVGVAPNVIELAWGAVSSLHDGFRIERSLNGQGDWSVIGYVAEDVLIFLDINATPLIVFDYRIIAFNQAGDAQPSNIAYAFSPAPGQPLPPKGQPPMPRIIEFKSPGVYGLDREPENGDTGFRF